MGFINTFFFKRCVLPIAALFLLPVVCAGGDGPGEDWLLKAFSSHPPSKKLLIRLKEPALPAGSSLDDLALAKAGISARVEGLLQRLGAGRSVVQALPVLDVAVIDMPEQGAGLAAQLASQPEVAWVEPALQRPFHGTEGMEPFFTFQWSLENMADPEVENELEIKGIAPLDFLAGSDIGARQAWETTQGNPSVVAAILDSGVDYTHIDLAPSMWRNPDEIPENGLDDDNNGYVDDIHGWHAYENHGDPMDNMGHGTHVAGIAAAAVNGAGIAGVAPNARIMAVNVADPVTQWEDDAAIITGIEYIVRQALRGVNVRVVNISLGGPGKSKTLQYAMERLAEAGVLAVVSMGNESASNDLFVGRYPVNCPIAGMISVGSSDPADQPSVFSNFGDYSCDVFSPGSAILSSVPKFKGDFLSWTDGEYFWSLYSGTSMSAPIVTGAAALAWGIHPTASWRQIKDLVLTSAKPRQALSGYARHASRVDVKALVESSLPNAPMLYRLGDLLPVPGQTTVIKGSCFGQEPGSVHLDGKRIKIFSWADDAVTIRLPRRPASMGPRCRLSLMTAEGREASMPFYMAGTGGWKALRYGETGGYEVIAPHERKMARNGRMLYGVIKCGPVRTSSAEASAGHLAWGCLDLRHKRLRYLCELPLDTRTDPIDWKWTAVTSLGEYVYCIGGISDGTVCRYHAPSGTWDFSIMQPMNSLLRGAAVTADGAGVYLAGGILQDRVTGRIATNQEVFRFYPKTGTWRVLGEWKTARLNAAALVVKNHLLLAGGTAFSFVAQAPFKTCDTLDLTNGIWTTTEMPTGASSGELARVGRRVYYFMPRDAMGSTTPFVFSAKWPLQQNRQWRIHPVRFQFTDLDRTSAWTACYRGDLYVAGGDLTGCPELPCSRTLKIFNLGL